MRLRFAFLKLPLNMNGISNRFVMPSIFSAIDIAISSPSIAQGPASRKKLLEFVCFIFGIKSRFIFLKFYDVKVR